MLLNKLLTKVNVKHRVVGLGNYQCVLFNGDNETINQYFISCKAMQKVWVGGS